MKKEMQYAEKKGNIWVKGGRWPNPQIEMDLPPPAPPPAPQVIDSEETKE